MLSSASAKTVAVALTNSLPLYLEPIHLVLFNFNYHLSPGACVLTTTEFIWFYFSFSQHKTEIFLSFYTVSTARETLRKLISINMNVSRAGKTQVVIYQLKRPGGLFLA